MSHSICACGAEQDIDHVCPHYPAPPPARPWTEAELVEAFNGLFADYRPNTTPDRPTFDDTCGIHGDLFMITVSVN